MGPGRAAQIGFGVASAAGLVGGLLTQNRAEEAGRGQGRSYEYTMLGNAFIPLPRTETQHALAAFAGAGALAFAGTKLADKGGALGGVGTALQGVGLGFMVGEAMGVIW